MLSKALRPCRLGLLLAGALGLAACSPPPPRPAMVAKSQTGDFGYTETRLAEDRYEIAYTSPQLRVPADPIERADRLDTEKQRAHDLALWRAAQIARQAGFVALQVEKDDRSADVTVRSEPDYYGPYGYPGRCWRPGGAFCNGYPGYFPTSETTYASARATAKLRVQMLKSATAESLDAAATEKRLAAAYAGATYPSHATY